MFQIAGLIIQKNNKAGVNDQLGVGIHCLFGSTMYHKNYFKEFPGVASLL